jgi:hypothetical protein
MLQLSTLRVFVQRFAPDAEAKKAAIARVCCTFAGTKFFLRGLFSMAPPEIVCRETGRFRAFSECA